MDRDFINEKSRHPKTGRRQPRLPVRDRAQVRAFLFLGCEKETGRAGEEFRGRVASAEPPRGLGRVSLGQDREMEDAVPRCD